MSGTRDSWDEWMGRIIGRDNCFEGLSLRHDEGGGEKKRGEVVDDSTGFTSP